MRRVARVFAQAKINLFLRVGPPLPTGFHDIATVFQRIDLADEILVRVGDDDERSLRCIGPRLPDGGVGPMRDNLAYRAAESFAARTGWPSGFAIALTKNIPVGGGLGGGSTDAGAVLRALQAIAPRPLAPDALRDVAADLGSDVPFLASEYSAAWGFGRGERLHALSARLRPAEVLLIVPSFATATADAYRWLDAARSGGAQEPMSSPPLDPLAASWDLFARGDLSGNDFEPVVESRHPVLRDYREQLVALGARIARLAGSGSCVAGVFDGAAPASGDRFGDAIVIRTRTSSRVVQVEVLE